MHALSIESFAAYMDYLDVEPDEFRSLFDTILINVTSFFRDELAWQYLKDVIIPNICKQKGAKETIRVWSAGCASGEEAYSLAILFAEELGEVDYRFKIYATDIDESALEEGRSAVYSEAEMKDVSPERREQYFERCGKDFVIRPAMRRTVIF